MEKHCKHCKWGCFFLCFYDVTYTICQKHWHSVNFRYKNLKFWIQAFIILLQKSLSCISSTAKSVHCGPPYCTCRYIWFNIPFNSFLMSQRSIHLKAVVCEVVVYMFRKADSWGYIFPSLCESFCPFHPSSFLNMLDYRKSNITNKRQHGQSDKVL